MEETGGITITDIVRSWFSRSKAQGTVAFKIPLEHFSPP